MATYAVSIYKDGILLGTGTANDAAATIVSYSGTAPQNGRNIQVLRTAGNSLGKSYQARVLSGSGTATLTLNTYCKFL